MKKKLALIIFLLTIFSVLMFTGCPSPMNSVDLDDPNIQNPSLSDNEIVTSGTIETGVTISIPRYAPWIGTQTASRAYGFTDSVEVTVYNFESAVIYNDTFEPTYDVNNQIDCDIILAPGTGYTVDIDIYNHVMSVEDPVVSGTSASFDIATGVVTQVPVICIPNNPTVAAADTVYDFSGMTAALDASGNPTGSSTEFWYTMTAPASGYFNVDVTIPADIIFYYGAFNDDGTAVISFGSAAGGPGPETLSFSVTPGEVYYFGLVYAGEEAEMINGSVSWTEVLPNYLTDEDVPDSVLRQLLESYTGKEFTIVGDPAPASPVSDVDLAALDSFRCDGYDGAVAATGISDLTGLSYCTGITYLGLGSNDFSGSNANFQELNTLTVLRSLDIGGSNLQNLDYLDYIANPSFNQTTFPDNPDISLSDILSITSTRFPNLINLGFNDYDTTGDGVADPISATDWSDIVDQLALFEHLGELRVGGLSLTDDMFDEFITEVINIRPLNWGWLYLSSSSISDISGLTGLANLYCLEIDNTDVTNLAPLKLLYDNDGAFQNPESWMDHDIDIRYCGLDLWPGTDNRDVVDYLISEGVRVDYEDGNDLIEPAAENDWEYSGGYTVSGTIDFSAMMDRDDVDFISLYLSDNPYTKSVYYHISSSEFDSYTVDYSYINLEPGEQYTLNMQAMDSDDNIISYKMLTFQSNDSFTQDVLFVNPNDWEYAGGYTVDGTIDFSALSDRTEVDHISVSLQDLYGNKYLNYILSIDDFTGYTAAYSFVNLEPDLQYDLYLQVQDSSNTYIVGKTEFFQETETFTQDIALRDENDWGYDGGGTLSGEIDFSQVSFADEIDNMSVQFSNTGNGDYIIFGISPDDFIGDSAVYEIINLDPSVIYYQIVVSVSDNDTGENTNTYQSNLQVPTTGMDLDLEIRDRNDWGYDGGGTVNGTIDFSGVSFASTVDSVQITLEDFSTGIWISKIVYLYPDDFMGYTVEYSFINADPDISSYRLGLYTASNSTSQYTNNTFTNIQVPINGLLYDMTATE